MLLVPKRTYTTNLFDDFFSNDLFKDSYFENRKAEQFMKTDIQELEDSYQLDIDIPGFNKEDISAELKDGYLTVTAKKEENKDDSDKKNKYIHRERYYGECKRSYFVGKNITDDDIKASFKQGTLRLEFPKAEAKKIEEHKKLIAIE